MTIPLKRRSDGLGEFQSGDAIPIEHGGTGATTISEAQNVLGISSKADQLDLDAVQSNIEDLSNEVDTKANAQSVNQALSLKSDLVNGKVPASQLPSFVDDVLEGTYINPTTFNDLSNQLYVPESGKIYVDTTSNKTYRWSGMLYVVISSGGVALGETSETAYRGDRGKVAYDHSQSQGNPHNSTTSDITEGTRQYFTEVRVRATLLTGLNTATGGSITAGDTHLSAFGKIQNFMSNQSGMTWVNVTSISGFAYESSVDTVNTKIELCKFGGMLWIRGYVRFRANVLASTEVFQMFNASYLPDYTYVPSTLMTDLTLYGASKVLIDVNAISLLSKWNMATATSNPITINTSYHIRPQPLFKHA